MQSCEAGNGRAIEPVDRARLDRKSHGNLAVIQRRGDRGFGIGGAFDLRRVVAVLLEIVLKIALHGVDMLRRERILRRLAEGLDQFRSGKDRGARKRNLSESVARPFIDLDQHICPRAIRGIGNCGIVHDRVEETFRFVESPDARHARLHIRFDERKVGGGFREAFLSASDKIFEERFVILRAVSFERHVTQECAAALADLQDEPRALNIPVHFPVGISALAIEDGQIIGRVIRPRFGKSLGLDVFDLLGERLAELIGSKGVIAHEDDILRLGRRQRLQRFVARHGLESLVRLRRRGQRHASDK